MELKTPSFFNPLQIISYYSDFVWTCVYMQDYDELLKTNFFIDLLKK